MATVSGHIAAPPHAVFERLSDGWHYVQWVVGTSHIRAVDAHWPAVGSRLHHAVGPWPLAVRDHTVVERVETDRLLELRARGWPLGEADVRIELAPEGDGTLVTIDEEPSGGPGWLVRNPVADVLIKRRNVESIARLAALVGARTQPAEEDEH